MPYDYYDLLKDTRDSDEYTEISDIIRQKTWNDSINFRMSLGWLTIEDLIRIKLYLFLRYN